MPKSSDSAAKVRRAIFELYPWSVHQDDVRDDAYILDENPDYKGWNDPEAHDPYISCTYEEFVNG